jgi:hypothetical protein
MLTPERRSAHQAADSFRVWRLIDADLADPPEMYDRLVIATPRRHQTEGLDPDTHTMDIKGIPSRPAVLNPGQWRGGRSSDSDGRSLHIAGSGQPAGPRHSTALNGVGSRTPAWAQLNRVEGGDSRRTGPSRTMIQDVQLEVGHLYANRQQYFATIRYSPLHKD